VVLSLPAFASTADFTGTLSTFTGGGTGIPTTTTPLLGSGTGVSFASNGGSFTIPSAAFTANVTGPVGWTSAAAANSIYTIRTVTNSSNLAGSFSGTAGSGPYTGTLGSGSSVLVELGIVPLPMVFGSLVLPVNVGSAGTVTAMAGVLSNPVTVTVIASGWTTGMITVSDQTVSAPTATTASSAVATGTNNLTANGGSITFVTRRCRPGLPRSPQARLGSPEPTTPGVERPSPSGGGRFLLGARAAPGDVAPWRFGGPDSPADVPRNGR
jgi:hypothetical protein